MAGGVCGWRDLVVLFWVCGLVVIGFLVLRFTGCFDCCGLLFKFGVRRFWVC